MSAARFGAALSLGLWALAPSALAAAADPTEPVAAATPVAAAAPAVAADSGDLQDPDQRDRRNSAYSLPRGKWGIDAGALGLGGGDAYAKLGVAYGVGAGVEFQINLAHVSVGLLNFATLWQFLDTPHFSLAARAGIWYGKGQWIWILTEAGTNLVRDLSVLNVPLVLASSMPISKRLQFDFDVQYTYADIFGSVTENGELFRQAPFGVRQFGVRPGVRVFLTDSTEFDVTTSLPFYSARSYLRPEADANSGDAAEFKKIPFSETWTAELGLRSRLSRALFGSVRFHYSKVARGLYGAAFYPSFNLEFRL